jgi:hypothetical protein
VWFEIWVTTMFYRTNNFYSTSRNREKLAAEQPMPGQVVQTSFSSFHHVTNHTNSLPPVQAIKKLDWQNVSLKSSLKVESRKSKWKPRKSNCILSLLSRVQWFWLIFTFWGITTNPWHPKGPRIWKLGKKILTSSMACRNFWQNRKMRFFGIFSKLNFRSPVWRIFTIFSACFKYGILNTAGQKVSFCLWNRSESRAFWSGPKFLFSRRLFDCPLPVQSAFPQLCKVFTVKWASPGLELLEERTADILFHLHWWNINIIVAASEYAKKQACYFMLFQWGGAWPRSSARYNTGGQLVSSHEKTKKSDLHLYLNHATPPPPRGA